MLRRLILLVLVSIAVPRLAMAEPKALRDVLPAPTGEYAVGRSTFYWKDATRQDTLSDGSRHDRELRVDVWYPAKVDANCVKAAYCPDLQAVKTKMGLETAAMGTIATHTYADAPLVSSAAKFPVILFSPGYGTNANQYTALAEELVSHGYLVATVDHPYQSAAIAYPDGRVIALKDANESKQPPANGQQALEHYRQRVQVRVEDLRLALDQLKALDQGRPDGRFAGRFDCDRVGIIGHSLGGVAAPALCLADPRVKACINMDGHANSLPIIPDEQGQGPRQPFLELTDQAVPPAPSDAQLAKWNVTREQFDKTVADQARRYETLMQTISGGSYRVTVPGATHQSFSDGVLWIAANPKEHQRRTQIIRDYTRAFFDKYLRGANDTMLDAPARPYENVTVERFMPRPGAVRQ